MHVAIIADDGPYFASAFIALATGNLHGYATVDGFFFHEHISIALIGMEGYECKAFAF